VATGGMTDDGAGPFVSTGGLSPALVTAEGRAGRSGVLTSVDDGVAEGVTGAVDAPGAALVPGTGPADVSVTVVPLGPWPIPTPAPSPGSAPVPRPDPLPMPLPFPKPPP
jgi:hypothetical protein